MIKADLISGFLGAGKTTFIAEYAEYFLSRGVKTAVIVNDYGAINVDRLFLERRLGGRCDIEMVIGGDKDCTMRRLKTKLIALAMDKYEQVIVEPSGIFEAEEFLDLLYDEPLGNWYRPGNIIVIADAGLGRRLSANARYILASQLAKAGKVVLSKVKDMRHSADALAFLQDCLYEFGSRQKLDTPCIWKPGEMSLQEFEAISNCGYRSGDIIKLPVTENGSFNSLFYFYVKTDAEKISETIGRIFADSELGIIYRIKGFLKKGEAWLEINAAADNISISESEFGQEVFIVIGEGLDREKVGKYWDSYSDEVQA